MGLLRLAYECEREALSVDPATREALHRALFERSETADAAGRALIGEVLLGTRLGKLVRLNDRVSLSDSCLTVAEYMLFLDEQGPGREHRPDHWADDPENPLETLAGVRFSDAAEFCAWLTDWARSRGIRGTFRLPTPEEVELCPAEINDATRGGAPGLVGTWCRDGHVHGNDQRDEFHRRILLHQNEKLRLLLGPPGGPLHQYLNLDVILKDVRVPGPRDVFADRDALSVHDVDSEHRFDIKSSASLEEDIGLIHARTRRRDQPAIRARAFAALPGIIEMLRLSPGTESASLLRPLISVAYAIQLIELRSRGEAPAWEGIRVAHEQE